MTLKPFFIATRLNVMMAASNFVTIIYDWLIALLWRFNEFNELCFFTIVIRRDFEKHWRTFEDKNTHFFRCFVFQDEIPLFGKEVFNCSLSRLMMPNKQTNKNNSRSFSNRKTNKVSQNIFAISVRRNAKIFLC